VEEDKGKNHINIISLVEYFFHEYISMKIGGI